MQHTSDDMDDLLRNAAENYPLKISGADWESVASRLTNEDGGKMAAPGVVVPVLGRKTYWYAALLLLLPFAYFLAKYAGRIGSDTGRLNLAKSASVKKEDNALIKNKAVLPSANAVSVVPQQLGSTNNATGLTNVLSRAALGIKTRNGGTDGDSRKARAVKKRKALEELARQQSEKKTFAINKILLASAEKANLIGKTTFPSKAADSALAKPGPVEKITATQPVDQNGNKASNEHIAKTKRFYIGAYGAPEYTTVKYQPGSKIGFNYGGLFGYKLNSKLSVEAGIAAGRKYYTSNGKYFNTDITWFRNLGKVLSLSGYSTLTEFPLSLKYNFKPSKEGNFFAAVGLISYVVHQEKYDYILDKNNTVYSVSKTPIVPTTDFFSNVSISGGYESKLGSLCSFRVEPYYRIPLKGIGIGSLPITSMGLNIGIIKKL